MKKRILTLLLALVLIIGTCSTVLATDSSTSDNQVNVEWVYDENGQCTWEVRSGLVEGVTRYRFELSHDGVASQWVTSEKTVEDYVKANFTISKNGKYSVKVYPMYVNEFGEYTEGECCGISETVTFVHPGKALGATTVTISEDKIVRFNAVEDAEFYLVSVELYDTENDQAIATIVNDEVYADKEKSGVFEVDISDTIKKTADEFGEKHYLIASVIADADDGWQYPSGVESFSNPYYIKLTTNDVKESLNEITTVEDGLTYLDSVTTETLQEAMETDTEVVEKIAEIEKMYAEENEITVSTTVEKDAQSLVDESKISMVGSALNAKNGETNVELVLSIPKKSVDVAETYKNAIPLEISLLIGKKEVSDLDVPITITMPMPKGVDTKNAVVLHYHNNATTPTVITPTVNADGTISFTISGFSTFVFANTVASNTTNNSTNTNGTTTTIQTAPATGDTTSVYFLVLAMMLALGSIVVCMKRRTFAKTN